MAASNSDAGEIYFTPVDRNDNYVPPAAPDHEEDANSIFDDYAGPSMFEGTIESADKVQANNSTGRGRATTNNEAGVFSFKQNDETGEYVAPDKIRNTLSPARSDSVCPVCRISEDVGERIRQRSRPSTPAVEYKEDENNYTLARMSASQRPSITLFRRSVSGNKN